MSPRHTTAIIPPPEDIIVSHKRVACDGGGGALGHPLVYLEMGEDSDVQCTYCDRRFVLTADYPGHVYHDPAARPAEDH